MPDARAKVRPGDALTISASTWNKVLELVGSSGGGGAAGPGQLSARFDATVVKVKNEAGAALARNAVVGLSAPVFLPTPATSLDAFLRGVVFRGVAPTAAHAGRFAVLVEPAPVDRVVRAYLAGVCPVKVNFTGGTGRYADVEAGSTARLTTALGGAAQVLWRAGEATSAVGEEWAVVRLGAAEGDRYAQLPAGGIAAGATGTVTFYNRTTGGALTLGSVTATARNDWATAAPASKKCLVGWASGALCVKNWDC